MFMSGVSVQGRTAWGAAARALRAETRWIASKRLTPDPNKVPRSEPIDLRDKAFKKTNTIEDYSIYDVHTPPNNIDSVTPDGFVLTSGARVMSAPEKPVGLLLLGHQAFTVDLRDAVQGLDSGRVELDPRVLGALDVVHPKPELLIVGLGGKSRILGPHTQTHLGALGLQIQLGSTAHSASNFDLLASERGSTVACFLLPPRM